jgi:hypothetical protein
MLAIEDAIPARHIHEMRYSIEWNVKERRGGVMKIYEKIPFLVLIFDLHFPQDRPSNQTLI